VACQNMMEKIENAERTCANACRLSVLVSARDPISRERLDVNKPELRRSLVSSFSLDLL